MVSIYRYLSSSKYTRPMRCHKSRDSVMYIFISPNEGRQDTQNNNKDRMTHRPKK